MKNLLLATAASLALASPLWAQDTAQDPAKAAAPAAPALTAYDAATVVATVNGAQITLGNLIAMRDALPDQYKSIPDEELYPGLLDQIIDQTLLAAQVSDSPEHDPLRVKLQLENSRRGALASEVVAKEFEGAVEEAKVKAAYDAAFKDFKPEPEFNASHILVATEDEAKAIEAQLKDGGDFAAIAKEKSTDTASGAQGGELGWFGLGRMVPEFETAVSSLQPGQVSDPVKTQFGWHIVKLNEKRDSAPPPLEEVRADFENQIRQEAFQARVAELRAAATITKAEPTVPPTAIRQSDLLSN